jgi:Tol biopolymer transport system component
VRKPIPHPGTGILVLLGLLFALVCLAPSFVALTFVSVGAGVNQVSIVSPPNGFVIAEGETVVVHAVSSGRGLVRSELLVDRVVVDVMSSPRIALVADWSVSHSWHAELPGQHRLSVRVSSVSGGAVESRSVVVAVPPPGTIAFSSNRTANYRIYRMRTDGRQLTAMDSSQGQEREPSCGDQGGLLFTLVADDGGSDVWLLDLQTGKGASLTASLGGDRSPRWAPDEGTIAFVSDRYGPSQLFLMNHDGSSQLQLTQEGFVVEEPSWAPDGSALLFSGHREDNWDIFAISLDGGSAKRVTEDPAQDWQPAWSPTGDEIAFASNRDGNQQIYVMQADGRQARRITAFPMGAEQPRWSPDGQWIVCVAYTGLGEGLNAREIYILRRDGSDQMRLTFDAFDDTEPDWCD